MTSITDDSPPAKQRVFRPFHWFMNLVWMVLRLYHPRNLREKSLAWLAALNLITIIAIASAIGIYSSLMPDLINVRTNALRVANGDVSKLDIPGYVTAATLKAIAETLVNKPGGYVRNDRMPPWILLDNIPAWEFGVLIDLRDTARTLRDHFARAQTQSRESEDLRMFDAQVHFDDNSWILPRTEDEYRRGIAAMENYMTRLENGNAEFFRRGDNLNIYFSTVEKRLGSFAHRLGQSVTGLEYTSYISTDDNLVDDLPTGQVEAATPWWGIDNVFYEARGYCWSLIHVLKAIEIDFHDLLSDKNALMPLRNIIHKLENTQNTVFSPVIMNNSGYGVLTNHSLTMASFISRANAAIIDLRILLQQG